MGNRAHVLFRDERGICGSAVYMHWNSGPEKMYAFLDELMEFSDPTYPDQNCTRAFEPQYNTARFIQIAGNFFGPGGLSLGTTNGPKGEPVIKPMEKSSVDLLKEYDHGDNGVYIVDIGIPGQESQTKAKKYTVYRLRSVKRPGVTDETPWDQMWEFRWLTKEETDKERRAARRSKEYQDMRDTLKRLREAITPKPRKTSRKKKTSAKELVPA